MTVCVLDGQGGGMGAAAAERLRALLPRHRLLCLGLTETAASRMRDASGGEAVTGEKNILSALAEADFLLGTAGILNAGSMKGDVTERIAAACATSPARKVIIPMNRCGLAVAGVAELSASELIREACDLLISEIQKEERR